MSKLNYTILLKLHKPSRRKKEIIDEAMVNYSRAYSFLLNKAWEQIDEIIEDNQEKRGKFRTYSIKNWISESLDKKLNEFSIEPFKDSLKIDFSAALAAYLKHRTNRKNVSYPMGYVDNESFKEEYSRILQEYSDGRADDETDKKLNKLVSRSEKLRPLFFCRYSTNRNYSILYDAQKDKYFAKIYLMNTKNEKRKRTEAENNNPLIYISENKEVFKVSRNKSTFILAPLCFGKWQEKYLRRALENPKLLKTARLIRKIDEYYLAINIEEVRSNEIITSNYMSIARGIGTTVNYSITNSKRDLIKEGYFNAKEKDVTLSSLYYISNELICMAKEYKCQIVMEKLIDKGDFLTWIDKSGKIVTPVLGCKDYNQLAKVINYKALGIGLPKVVMVSAVNIYNTCSRCGNTSRKNRFSKDLIICTSCGTAGDVNKIGSLNLANKILVNNIINIRILVEDTNRGLKFSNKDLGLEYYTSNSYNCKDELMEAVDNIIKEFYVNIDAESKGENFKKKYSLIKKIEYNKDIFELIQAD